MREPDEQFARALASWCEASFEHVEYSAESPDGSGALAVCDGPFRRFVIVACCTEHERDQAVGRALRLGAEFRRTPVVAVDRSVPPFETPHLVGVVRL